MMINIRYKKYMYGLLGIISLIIIVDDIRLRLILNKKIDFSPAPALEPIVPAASYAPSPSNSFVLSDSELREIRKKAMQGDAISMEKLYLHYEFEESQDSIIELKYWHERIRSLANSGDPEAKRFFEGIKDRKFKK